MAAPALVKLSPLGKQFAAYLSRLDHTPEEAVRWAAQLAYQAVADGQVCLRLDDYAGSEAVVEDGATVVLPTLDEWLAALRKSRLIGSPGSFAPLVLDANNRLYLTRYWRYEKTVADSLKALAESPCPEIDEGKLRTELDLLFAHNTEVPDRQSWRRRWPYSGDSVSFPAVPEPGRPRPWFAYSPLSNPRPEISPCA